MAVLNFLDAQSIKPLNSRGDTNKLSPLWKKWKSLNYYLLAAETDKDPQKRAILPNTLGPEQQEYLIRYMMLGRLLQRLCNLWICTFCLRRMLCMSIICFMGAWQLENETIAAYVTRLRSLMRKCGYSNGHKMIWDNFFMIFISAQLRQYLLQ